MSNCSYPSAECDECRSRPACAAYAAGPKRPTKSLTFRFPAGFLASITADIKKAVDDAIADVQKTIASAEAIAEAAPPPRPPIVCLCGSTRFHKTFDAVNHRLTLDGWIVLAPGVYGHEPDSGHEPSSPEKALLDILHLHKISIADRVLVIDTSPDVAHDIGKSTAAEIDHAQTIGKPVFFLSIQLATGWSDFPRLRPSDFLPTVDAPCPVCGEPRFSCPSGPVCKNGHGG